MPRTVAEFTIGICKTEGCGKEFKKTGRWNVLCPSCQDALRKMGRVKNSTRWRSVKQKDE